jgi:photosystem II stability/assembly factor-like uncharacterized protein
MPRQTIVSLALLTITAIGLGACNPAPLDTSEPTQSGSTATITPAAPTLAHQPPTSTEAPSPTPLPPTETPARTDIPNRLSAGQPFTITRLSMFDATTGWAVGQDQAEAGHVLRTTDGGINWQDVTASPVPLNPYVVADFRDANEAWVIYPDQTLWHTTGGGQSWEALGSISDPNQGGVTELGFSDSQNGWKAGGGAAAGHVYLVVSTTSDGGRTWKAVANNYPDAADHNFDLACYPKGFTFPGAQTGWAVGDCFGIAPGPFVFATTPDGGRTWQTQAMPPPPDRPTLFDDVLSCSLFSPVYASASNWKLGLSCNFASAGSPRSWLYTTADQGRTWVISSLPAGYSSSLPYGNSGAFDFISSTVGWWLGWDGTTNNASQLYQTSDGGGTWTLLKRTGWSGAQLDFIDEQTGWAVVQSCNDADCATTVAALVKTEDGGKTWKEIKPQIAP